MKKALYYQKSFLGALGESTGRYALSDETGSLRNVELKVGDVVSFIAYKKIYTRVVVKNSIKNEFGIFGFGSNELDYEMITKILSYEDLTEDIFQKLQENNRKGKRSSFTMKDIEIREMTMKELEKELGYKVKIV